MHIGDGMYGAVIVDRSGRPAAREYVIVQSEFYGAGGDYKAMLNNAPDVVCFNGQAFRYQTTPLTAKAGELVRFFVMNAGPSSTSAFHVIGDLFDAYEPEGNPANRMGMHQTISVAARRRRHGGARLRRAWVVPVRDPQVQRRAAWRCGDHRDLLNIQD